MIVMKKYFSILIASIFCGFFAVSCDTQTDIEAGGTAVQDMAGNWDVQVDLAAADGEVLEEDIYGFTLYTYNTADNVSNTMWIDDRGKFWAFNFKTDVNLSMKNFQTSDYVPYDAAETGNAKIVNGKVMLGAATNLHGMPNDSMAFLITFDDDEDPDTYYLIHGQRYTGFSE